MPLFLYTWQLLFISQVIIKTNTLVLLPIKKDLRVSPLGLIWDLSKINEKSYKNVL